MDAGTRRGPSGTHPLALGFVRLILRFRWLILVLLLVATAWFGFGLTHWNVAQSMADDLPENDPEVTAFEEFNEQFTTGELIVVTVEAQDIFTEKNLRLVRTITERLAAIPGIDEAISLTNVADIVGTGDGIEVQPLVDDIPADPSALARIRAKTLANPAWVGNLVGADGTVASVNGSMPWLAKDENIQDKLAVSEAVRALASQLATPDAVLRVTGLSPVFDDTNRAIQHDLVTYLWMTPVLIVLLLLAVFRSPRGVVIPTSVIVISVVWILGTYFHTGRSVTMITAMLPPLVAVIGLSDMIHVLARYYEEMAGRIDHREGIARATAAMMKPCFLTSLTTAVGFGSLLLSDIRQLKDFGMFTAIALGYAYLLSMTLVPILLSFFPPPGPGAGRRYEEGLVRRTLEALGRFVNRDRWITPTVIVLLAAASVVGIARLKVETQMIKFLPQAAPSIQAMEHVQEHLAGMAQLEVTVTGEGDVFKEPWALLEIENLTRFLASEEIVSKTFSILDVVKEIHRAMNEGSEAYYHIPENRDLIAQYLFLLGLTGRDDLAEAFVSYEYDTARIAVRLKAVGSARQLELLHAIDDWAEEHLDPRLQVHTTGAVKLYAVISDAIVRSQLRSLFVAMGIITLLMVLTLRNWRIGLVSMVPNLLPILVTLGALGLLGFTLNVATAMIACIALGIAVDDTIHYLVRYRTELDAPGHPTVAAAMEQTLLHTGRAILFTSVVIAGGFSILLLSGFEPNRTFGVAVAITMGTALLADLVVLPTLVRRLNLGR